MKIALFISSTFIYFALSLDAPAAGSKLTTADQVAQTSKVSYDPYLRCDKLMVQAVSTGEYGLSFYALAAMKSPKVKQSALLVGKFRYSYEGWMFLQSAHDIDGKMLSVRVLTRNVEPGGTQENVAIEFPGGYIAAHQKSGINVRIDGQNGSSLTVVVPSFYVEGFWRALQSSQEMR